MPEPRNELNLTLPIDGLGGSLYNTPIPIPIYNPSDPTVQNYTTFRTLDYYASIVAQRSMASSMAITLCSLTITHILLLVPASKRRLPLYTLLLLALVATACRNAIDLHLLLRTSYSPAYIMLTNDLYGTTYSGSQRAHIAGRYFCSLLGLMVTHALFFIQCRGLLSWLRLRYARVVYNTIMSVLLTLAGLSVLWYMAATGFMLVYFVAAPGIPDPQLSQYWTTKLAMNGARITVSVALASWSTVFVVAALGIMWRRRELVKLQGLRKVKGVVDVAVELIVLVGLQSFLVPLMLCILQFLISKTHWFSIEVLTMPTILCLMPVSSLFINAQGSLVVQEFAKLSSATSSGSGSQELLSDDHGKRFAARIYASHTSLRGDSGRNGVGDSSSDARLAGEDGIHDGRIRSTHELAVLH